MNPAFYESFVVVSFWLYCIIEKTNFNGNIVILKWIIESGFTEKLLIDLPVERLAAF